MEVWRTNHYRNSHPKEVERKGCAYKDFNGCQHPSYDVIGLSKWRRHSMHVNIDMINERIL